jgi:DHA1 family bicyclomycin/chloramphenicol resistance-like MFS transporter
MSERGNAGPGQGRARLLPRIDPARPVSPLGVALFAAAIFALLPVSTDLYLPALPGLKRDLGASDAQSQLTLSAFVVGFGIAQLFYGPVSDRFGRRPALLGGVALYAGATLACLLAPSVEVLVAARFLQGMGACSGQVMARAVVRDLFEPADGARVMAHMTYLFGLVPFFAPLIGGHLTVAFGWRANFAFLLAFGLAILILVFALLGETNRRRDREATRIGRMIANAGIIWRSRTFAGYTLCVTFSYCGLFSYLSASPFVLVDDFGVEPQDFGWWFMLSVTGNICGALVCSRLARRVPLARLLGLSSSVTTAGGLLMLALAAGNVMHPLAVMGPMFIYLLGHGMTTPVCLAAAVGPFPGLAGTASALLGFTQLAVAAVAGQIVLRLHDGTALPLAVAVAVFGCTVLFTQRVLVRSADRR